MDRRHFIAAAGLRERGLSLVELIVAFAISLVILAAATSIFGSTAGANSTQMKISRLNNELRTVMTAITRDMRRAGYHSWSVASLTTTDFDISAQSLPVITASQSSGVITVSYDLNSTGQNNTFAFRLNAGSVEAAVGAGSFTKITDPNVVKITALRVTDRSPTDITVSGTVTTASGTCLTKAGATSATTTTARTVTIPAYEVEVSGELVSDASIKRTLREVVRLRNIVLTC